MLEHGEEVERALGHLGVEARVVRVARGRADLIEQREQICVARCDVERMGCNARQTPCNSWNAPCNARRSATSDVHREYCSI